MSGSQLARGTGVASFQHILFRNRDGQRLWKIWEVPYETLVGSTIPVIANYCVLRYMLSHWYPICDQGHL